MHFVQSYGMHIFSQNGCHRKFWFSDFCKNRQGSSTVDHACFCSLMWIWYGHWCNSYRVHNTQLVGCTKITFKQFYFLPFRWMRNFSDVSPKIAGGGHSWCTKKHTILHVERAKDWPCRVRDPQPLPWPGFEPGLSRPQRELLTTIRSRPLRQHTWCTTGTQSFNNSTLNYSMELMHTSQGRIQDFFNRGGGGQLI